MTHKLRRKHVSTTIEKRILTSLIVSTQFNQEIVPLLNLDYFTNSFIRKVAKWCISFFLSYEVAPFNHIQDIFNEKQVELQEEDAELIQKILTDISKKYELDEGLNVEYSIDQTLRFFRKRELEITHGNIGMLLEKDDVESAEDQINQFTKVARVASGWIDPFDEKYVDEVFERKQGMFQFPGQLGEFLGSFDRGWLIAVAAGFKRGKTWSLQEIAITAILQRLKVAFFSLEMGERESLDRHYKRMLGAGNTQGGESVYPCFDCEHNQNGACNKPERINKLPLTTNSEKPPFSQDMQYRPCTACRFTDPKEYRTAWWYEIIKRPAYTPTIVKEQLAALRKMYPNSYRFKKYPKFSANTSDIRRDLDIIERTDDFVPDVIIVDQANGLAAEDGIQSGGVEQPDAAWKSLARLAGERYALVVSPTQVTRTALEKKNLKQGDVAQWIGLLGHVDCAYSLNQTPEEKAEGVMRYEKMIHRHEDFNEKDMCIVLQKIYYGQAHLDAQIVSAGGVLGGPLNT